MSQQSNKLQKVVNLQRQPEKKGAWGKMFYT